MNITSTICFLCAIGKGENMVKNSYVDALNEHERVKYRLEGEIRKYTPYIPEIQTLLAPPKGSYCNADYIFCPYLMWGGFCKELYVRLHAVDGQQFTTITNDQFWKCFSKDYTPKETAPHGVAVGSYKVFKKICGKRKVAR